MNSTAAAARRTSRPFDAEEPRRLHQQERPQPLAARKRRVAHRRDQPLGPGDLARKRARREQLRQRLLDGLAGGGEPALEFLLVQFRPQTASNRDTMRDRNALRQPIDRQ